MPHRMLPRLSQKDFNLLQKLVNKKVGISIKPVRKDSLSIRLAPRLQKLGLTSYYAYYHHLLKPEGTKELRHLISIVTIDITEFFRGNQQVICLREHILPDLIQQKNYLMKNVSGFGHQDVLPVRKPTAWLCL